MRLTHLMSNRVIIARRATTSGDKMAYVTVTAEMMNFQPVGDSNTEIREGTFGKQFRVYCEGGIDLKEGDRLRDIDSGNEYTVMPDGVSHRTMGSIDFIMAVLQKNK